LATQGLRSFHGADYLMVVYGCYRTGTRVLCDFDLMKLNAAQVGVGPFAAIALVDDGGQITRRHDAYYMGTDGRRMQAAYVSTAPVRYAMEFDNVGEQIKFHRVSSRLGTKSKMFQSLRPEQRHNSHLNRRMNCADSAPGSFFCRNEKSERLHDLHKIRRTSAQILHRNVPVGL
jgi:hypothetical protein